MNNHHQQTQIKRNYIKYIHFSFMAAAAATLVTPENIRTLAPVAQTGLKVWGIILGIIIVSIIVVIIVLVVTATSKKNTKNQNKRTKSTKSTKAASNNTKSTKGTSSSKNTKTPSQ